MRKDSDSPEFTWSDLFTDHEVLPPHKVSFGKLPQWERITHDLRRHAELTIEQDKRDECNENTAFVARFVLVNGASLFNRPSGSVFQRRSHPRLQEWFKRIKRRRGATIARVAVMRKLATIIWHMLTKRISYLECRQLATQ